jgi:7-keto-8-aminopelargonate synthetase-like enzyme
MPYDAASAGGAKAGGASVGIQRPASQPLSAAPPSAAAAAAAAFSVSAQANNAATSLDSQVATTRQHAREASSPPASPVVVDVETLLLAWVTGVSGEDAKQVQKQVEEG